jgi:phosphoribosylanthranilate isomerase
MTEIKICGITTLEDALCAADCGADAVGFIFYEASPRYVEPERAKRIVAALPPGIAKVGVFVNLAAEEVARTMEDCGLEMIQLHGDESPATCRLFPRERVIKAVSLRTPEEIRMIEAYDVRAFLMDARVAGLYGGTGKRVDWKLAALATVAPHAVDINSGVERAPGIKDHDRMRRIIRMIRALEPPGARVIFGKD